MTKTASGLARRNAPMPTHTVVGGFPAPGLSMYRVRWYKSAVAARAVIVPSSPPVAQYTNGRRRRHDHRRPHGIPSPHVQPRELVGVNDRYDPKHHR